MYIRNRYDKDGNIITTLRATPNQQELQDFLTEMYFSSKKDFDQNKIKKAG